MLQSHRHHDQVCGLLHYYHQYYHFSALENTFLLFLQPAERFQDDYNIAVAMVATLTLHTADRYGYELRLFDEAGFAYRGPLLSVVVRRELFWTQVSPWSYVGYTFQ